MEFQIVNRLPDSVQATWGKRRGSNFKYRKLMLAVREAAGAWIEVDAKDVAGANPDKKYHALYQAARTRGVAVNIASGDGKLYVRLAPNDEATHA
jgi:hypothetical protein